MKNIAVFISGGGTNLQSLIDAFESGLIRGGRIEMVFSNKKDAFGLERAKKHNIPAIYSAPEDFPSPEEYDSRLAGLLKERGIGLVCLAGYMKILTKAFLDNFNGDIMNVHPALLPSFGGPGMYGMHVHEAVIGSGVKVSGCTVHFVDYGTDTGPIIIQKTVPVGQDDTPQVLQNRILPLEHEAYREAVKLYCEGRLEIKGRKVFIR
jgi:phosphoribosylglycinamide formyltransferase-1